MIHIYKLYQRFTSEYRTSQSGFYRLATDFVPALHTLSLKFFNKMGPKAYQNQQFADLLTPMTTTANVVVRKDGRNNSFAPYPPDYVYFASSRVLVDKKNLSVKAERDIPVVGALPEHLKEDFFVDDDVDYVEKEIALIEPNRWAAVLSHKTKGPEMSSRTQRGFIKQRDKGFEVVPKEVGVIVLDYCRLPKEPKINYTTRGVGPDRYIDFIEQGSVHLEWSEAMIPVFLYHLGKHYGLSVKDQLIMQVRNVNEIFE